MKGGALSKLQIKLIKVERGNAWKGLKMNGDMTKSGKTTRMKDIWATWKPTSCSQNKNYNQRAYQKTGAMKKGKNTPG